MVTLFEQSDAAENTVLIGRHDELAAIGAQLRSPFARLVSLVGPAGVGKTSLVRRAGIDNLSQFPDGACYVPAAAMGMPSLLTRALCRAYKIEIGAEDARASLVRQLGSRRSLLVLDEAANYPEARVLIKDLMAAGPFLKILATGKAPLGLAGEKVITVSGLGVADEASGNTGGSVELFMSVARKADPGFKLSAFDSPFVGRVCGLLQGNPLALALAASMLQMLTASELCRALEADPVLASQMARGAVKGGGLEAVLSKCWSLLHQDRRQGLERLSIFESGFSRQEAEMVAGVGFTLLGLLSGKSLLQKQSAGRYELSEAVRAFARLKLQASPEELEKAQGNHLSHFGALLARADKNDSLDASLMDQLPDLRAMWRRQALKQNWDWLAEKAHAYHALLKRNASYQELWEDFSALLSTMDRSDVVLPDGPLARNLRAQLLSALGAASLPLGRPADGQRFLLDAVHDLRLLGSSFLGQRREALGTQMALVERYGDVKGFETELQQCAADCREASDLNGQADALRLLGLRSGFLNDSASARRYLNDSAALLRKLDNRVALVWTLSALADRANREGDLAEARRSGDEILRLSESTQDKSGRIWARRLMADLDMQEGESARAARLMAESVALCDPSADKWTHAYFSNKLGEALRMDGRLDEAVAHASGSRATFSGIHESWGEAWAADFHGFALALSGDLKGGLALMEEAALSLRKVENTASLIACLGHQAECRMAQGETSAAWGNATESLRLAALNATLSLSERLDLLVNASLILAPSQGRSAATLLSFALKQAALSHRSRVRAEAGAQKLRLALSASDFKTSEDLAKRMDLAAAIGKLEGISI